MNFTTSGTTGTNGQANGRITLTQVNGAAILTNSGGRDVFVARLNSAGVWQWGAKA